MKQEKQEKMSIFGVGLKLFIPTGIYALLIYALEYFGGISGKMPFDFDTRMMIGGVLIILGFALLAKAGAMIIKGHGCDELCTDGAYALCRHPIYSAWIVFVIPGVCLMLHAWFYLTVPVFAAGLFRILIKQEEQYLEQRFGQKYLDYKVKTPLLFPRVF